ncbi:protein FAM185A isoform X2 [Denticeps clupeoides]|uniref:protein FAM185A isoform X2 n=1 Tax=Denticeps clupeoides TaxID=299321 RepID=UPI0010A2F4BB|nr:protein FAM185A isoform X2 [Denticeps clupeoides]
MKAGNFFKGVPLLCLRAFSSGDLKTPLQQWTLAVSPFTKVRAQLCCDLTVRPLDPHSFPEADQLFITVFGSGAEHDLKPHHLQVHYNHTDKELIIKDNVSSHVSVHLTAPIKNDLFIETQGTGNVSIQGMENDVCKVQTERGHCVLTSLRSHHVSVQSGGDITGFGTIHGNVDVCSTGDSTVDLHKIQGTTMNVSTEHGLLKVKAIYAESTTVMSSSGQIQLGHVHGDASVQSVMGDVAVGMLLHAHTFITFISFIYTLSSIFHYWFPLDSSNGSLKVSTKSGNIDIYVGQSGSADLSTQEGSVSVRVPANITAALQLSGSSVEISPEICLIEAQRETTVTGMTLTGHFNGPSATEQWIKTQAAKGTISLRIQSWLETLRLGS